MRSSLRRTAAVLWTLLFVFAAGCSVTPMPEKLAAWSTQLRNEQPAGSYISVFERDETQLIFMAAKHSADPRSDTFQIIDEVYDMFDVEILIKEGFPYSRGENDQATIKRVLNFPIENGLQIGGEAFPSIAGAVDEGAIIVGGEPDDPFIRDRMKSLGFSEEDVVGFYTLRTVPQWLREGRIVDYEDPRLEQLLISELNTNRKRLELPDSVLRGTAAWKAWYNTANKKEFGSSFNNEEVGPLIDGEYKTNTIASSISRIRAEFLHDLYVDSVRRRLDTFVIFGASHTLIHRPAIEAVFGPPCYVGEEAEAAVVSCRKQ